MNHSPENDVVELDDVTAPIVIRWPYPIPFPPIPIPFPFPFPRPTPWPYPLPKGPLW